ncbi:MULTISPECIES: hypothetical protein [Sporosarcina]|uniref:hypothetical protein n=1 Tax=Sporosarcina TaxID=1569 RepID=UPI00129ABB3A|nr:MULTISPECIES: hypothetical protein [Sporosarcina]GKV67417.1 hypothetical protein NCCP2331_35700 [Sporosarcina sp. NCCP-2331]GLB57773.1 hypothetical protein NCCP2378_35640 [Sporosarcina sp. NCCP-2378]
MNKTVQWIIWVLALIAINLPAISFASFALFGTSEGTSLFSIDYLIAALIVMLANVINLQLFIVIKRNHYKGFIYGLILAVMEAGSLYLFAFTFYMPWMIISGIIILAAIGLLVKEMILKK